MADLTRQAAAPYVFAAPATPSLTVCGTERRFPIHRIYCVGRNYAAHAVEMGHDPEREPPFFFQKNPDSVVPGNGDFPYPAQSEDVHHEIELVVALRAGGRDISVARARDCIFGYAVGLDMTRRDLQSQAKRLGRPWEVGKAFDFAAACGEIAESATIGHPDAGAIWLNVNGVERQRGDLNQLIWKVPEVICNLSALFTLAAGDLIYTGTPAGVGPIQRGDVMQGGIEGVGGITVNVV